MFSEAELKLVRLILLLDFSLQRSVIMAYRKKMSKRNSKRSFSKHASRTHRKNLSPAPMRGGIRL